jgi:hypothetical protein
VCVTHDWGEGTLSVSLDRKELALLEQEGLDAFVVRMRREYRGLVRIDVNGRQIWKG